MQLIVIKLLKARVCRNDARWLYIIILHWLSEFFTLVCYLTPVAEQLLIIIRKNQTDNTSLISLYGFWSDVCFLKLGDNMSGSIRSRKGFLVKADVCQGMEVSIKKQNRFHSFLYEFENFSQLWWPVLLWKNIQQNFGNKINP